VPSALSKLLAAVLLGLAPPALCAQASATSSVEAQFRGCEAAGWCRFRVEPAHPAGGLMLRVRPDGVTPMLRSDADAIALRDRLNALLASMIHQHKRIELHGLRSLEDGTFAAAVTVNGVQLASDPVLREMLSRSVR
jgi:hypothetical protein